jgi:23S rRNA (pseudouridine1915-N3)-methyltransferase
MANKLRIISVGKVHDAQLKEAIAMYQKRLSASIPVEWVLLAPKTEATRPLGIASESNSILRTLKEAEFVILFDEKGEQYTSDQFSDALFTGLRKHKDAALIIGGAYGVNDEVKKRAHHIVSFGAMVFPHQLVRLMVIEQLYRAACIQLDNGYHHS